METVSQGQANAFGGRQRAQDQFHAQLIQRA
jgi:hypothetical protein